LLLTNNKPLLLADHDLNQVKILEQQNSKINRKPLQILRMSWVLSFAVHLLVNVWIKSNYLTMALRGMFTATALL